MHSNSWRAAGKTCRRRRPRGETQTRVIYETLPRAQSVVLTDTVCLQPQDGCARRSGGGEERGRGAETNGKEEKKELIALNVFKFHSRGRTAGLKDSQFCFPLVTVTECSGIRGTTAKKLEKRQIMHKPHRGCDSQLFTCFCYIIYFSLQSAQFTRMIYKI